MEFEYVVGGDDAVAECHPGRGDDGSGTGGDDDFIRLDDPAFHFQRVRVHEAGVSLDEMLGIQVVGTV